MSLTAQKNSSNIFTEIAIQVSSVNNVKMNVFIGSGRPLIRYDKKNNVLSTDPFGMPMVISKYGNRKCAIFTNIF